MSQWCGTANAELIQGGHKFCMAGTPRYQKCFALEDSKKLEMVWIKHFLKKQLSHLKKDFSTCTKVDEIFFPCHLFSFS